MANIPVADFSVSDGLTPQQADKLNSNFRAIIARLNELDARSIETLDKANSSLDILSHIIQ